VLLDLGFLWAERDYIQMGEYRQRALDLAPPDRDESRVSLRSQWYNGCAPAV